MSGGIAWRDCTLLVVSIAAISIQLLAVNNWQLVAGNWLS
jgi:hypothetical protein